MGAPRHPPEVRARALGALYASAEEVGDELVPNFYAVAKQVGLDHTVMMRWWRERDTSADAEARTQAARAREDAAKGGAREWYANILTKLQARIRELVEDEERWRGAEVDAAARAQKSIAETADKMTDMLGVRDVDGPNAGDGGGSAGAINDAVRRALDRARGLGPAGEDG